MRKFAFLLLVAGIALPAFAARRVTVQQLEQILAAAQGKPDVEVARQLSDLELTERLNSVNLANLEATLLGDDARHALIALADASAFLNPPAAEVPSTPAPDFAQQRKMLALTVAYVSKTIPTLPNFFATRETEHFEDTPQLQKNEYFVPYQPIHHTGVSSVTVLYRDGREAIDTGASKKPPAATEGLAAHGVFGPILATVLLDAAQSKLTWSRWESEPSGPQAVFAYAVPKEKSHYEVNYCCVAAESATVAANVHPFRSIVGYHGDIAIDPATGTILRLRVEAELKPGDPVLKAGIMVEYGPVEIGSKTYFCPVRSVSNALAQTVQVDPKYHFPLANQLQPLKTSIIDVAFDQYHVFRAEARLLPSGTPDKETAPDALNSASPASLPPIAPPSSGLTSPETASAAAVPPASPSADTATPPSPIETASAAPATPAPEPAIPEFAVAETTGLPDISPAPHLTASDSGFTLRTTSRLVDVGVVAYDKKGHPLTDLKQEDFEVYDNGHKQSIRYFGQAAQTRPSQSDQPLTSDTAAQSVYTNRPATEQPAQPGTTPAENHATILLLDAANLAWGDLTYARQEILRFLKTLPNNEPVALYILRSTGFQVLLEPTEDHGLVADKLSHWMPSAQDLSRAQDEEQRNRQHIDWVAHTSDLAYVNGNDGSDPQGSPSGDDKVQLAEHGVDPQLRSMGSNPQRDVLLRLEIVAHHLAFYPGHKSLAWISSDNALADWSSQAAVREEKGSNALDPFTARAREALNESHVSIYPVDVSQLEASVITADLENRLVQAKLTAPNASPGPPPNPTGRMAAEMHQDTHPIQGAFRDLAEATGGRALRRSGDIAGELKGIADDGRAAYLLSFTPDGPADDKYHQLTLKLASRRDVTLRYRTGFQYDKEPATLKDRFRQAIWQPTDVREIALTATPVSAPKGATINLNISATDLALAQQGELLADKLDIFLVERDDAGLHAKVTGQTLGLRLKSATYQKILREGLPFEQSVEVRPKTGSVRIVVVDENSGRIGSVTIPADAIGETQEVPLTPR